MEPSSVSTSRSAEIAYEAIAPVYDDFTARNDHELWLSNVLPELRRHGLRGRRLLDVGCGTGKSFLPMLNRGWEVTACDISPAMLGLARDKVGDAVQLSVADMRKLPVFGEFDLVCAQNDAVNYLLGPDELADALRGMRANLAPGGLLLFDLNTIATYRSFFSETLVVERNGWRLAWSGEAESDTPPGSICQARFDAEGGEIESHIHRQRHFPEAEVLDLLKGTGLECLAVYGHAEDAILKQPLDESDHGKAIYVAQLAHVAVPPPQCVD